jgi:hypothetical protein
LCIDEPGPPQQTVVLAGEDTVVVPGLGGNMTEQIARKYGGDNWESSYDHIANTPDRVIVSYTPTRVLTWNDSGDRREYVQKFK